MGGGASLTFPSGGYPSPLLPKIVLRDGVRQRSSPADPPDVGPLESAWPSLDIPWEFDVVVVAVAPEGLALALGTPVPSWNGAGPGYNEFCILLESPLDDVHSAESENPDNPGVGCLSAARNRHLPEEIGRAS